MTVTEDTVSVQDNGPGLPASTLEHSLDYMVRVSDKAHYVSPTRGQLGNALKCVWAAPYVLDGTHGRVEVSTGGCTHQIDVTLDRIAQQPKVEATTREDAFGKSGTCITLHWPGIASSLENAADRTFYNVEALPPPLCRLQPARDFPVYLGGGACVAMAVHDTGVAQMAAPAAHVAALVYRRALPGAPRRLPL